VFLADQVDEVHAPELGLRAAAQPHGRRIGVNEPTVEVEAERGMRVEGEQGAVALAVPDDGSLGCGRLAMSARVRRELSPAKISKLPGRRPRLMLPALADQSGESECRANGFFRVRDGDPSHGSRNHWPLVDEPCHTKASLTYSSPWRRP